MAISADHGKSIFRKTDKALLRLASERGAAAVHGFRTTSRRLQTMLEQLVTNDSRKLKKLLKMLNRIRKSAGKVRDIDVQLDALRSLKVPQEPRRKTQLVQNLIDLRAKHERRLRKLLKKEDIRDIRKRLKRAAESVRLDASRDPLAVARQMLTEIASPSVPTDEKTLHRYRITVKRARYAAEFAAKSPESTQFLSKLKRLQDALGKWHDWLTLTHSAIEQLGNVHESSLVAVLYNVTRGKLRQAVAAVAAAREERPAEANLQPTRKTAEKKFASEQSRGAAA